MKSRTHIALYINAGLLLALSSLYALSLNPISNIVNLVSHPPTPTNLESMITSEKVDLAQCRDDAGQPTEDFWIVLHLANENPNYWVQGKGTVKFLDKGENLVGGFNFDDLTIPANSQIWFIDSNLLNYRPQELKGGTYNHIELSYSNLEWNETDGSEKLYDWKAEIISHSTPSAHYPRHSLNIKITNTGAGIMYRTRVLAVIYNSVGKLVDIAWSEKPRTWPIGITIRPSTSELVKVDSIAKTGRCLGEADPNGYKVEYWIDTLSSSGQPLIGNYSVALP
jgi:hypothetical protein